MKIGIIGFGGFGQFLFNSWSALENAKVTAVADLHQPRQSPGVRWYSDPIALMDDPEVDIIAIATPPDQHLHLALRAIAKGKHVLVEKPMALEAEHVREIYKTAKDHDVIAGTNFMLRFNPLVEALRNVVLNGHLGQLLHLRVLNLAQDESLPQDHWFWDQSISGGILLEHAVHFFDLAYYVSGQKPVTIDATSSWRNAVQQDRVHATINHDNNLISSHFHSFSRPGFMEETSIELIFDLGKITVSGWIPLHGHFEVVVDNPDVLDVLPGVEINTIIPLSELADESRPAGWGIVQESAPADHIRSGGSEFRASRLQKGTFGLKGTKTEVYAYCVRQSLLDMIHAIDDRSYVPCIKPDEVIACIDIARKATEDALN